DFHVTEVQTCALPIFTTVSRNTHTSESRSGARVPIRRLADGQKFSGFSTAIPCGPPWAPWRAAAGARVLATSGFVPSSACSSSIVVWLILLPRRSVATKQSLRRSHCLPVARGGFRDRRWRRHREPRSGRRRQWLTLSGRR